MSVADRSTIRPDPNAVHWSVEEAAVFLGLAPCSIRVLISTGKLGHLRIGPNSGRIRITPNDCETYLQRCRVAPKEERPAAAFVPRPPVRQPFILEGPIERELARRAAREKR